ncbi:gliding motility-associated C-terminal domain-containing protein [Spirosoma spitsbergense]|uniref:gliding motility-associated C-terminal domain-containing protein n=1 Tax=Spirosoma spitsbergense TaxID=431554 RepID=UPI000370743E|nr:gliding motility-associated C-terminal domain-containing protein [Spirosoma spitsbergense]
MRFSTICFLFWLCAMGIPLASLATHQVGGQIEMRAVANVPGQYRIIVTNYLEDGTRGAALQATTGILGIFRKRDNVQMTIFTVVQTSAREPVIYANEFCAAQRNLKFISLTYEASIQLNPGTYADPQGYYISYQTRNRNSGINNINGPDQTGFTFYLEFPALQQNGRIFSNSSPRFGPINGEYVCLGDPFTFPFGGTDPDGDELRYSMITPLNQKGTNQNSVSPAPYPDVSWLPGYSAANAIQGSPALGVDAKTGQLSVTATQLGLFVFAVKVEEYRNGIKIGEVRRDFQLLVIDCPPQTTPKPDVQIANRPTLRSASICQGDSAILRASLDTTWNYQWRKDGINIVGATKSSLAVREAGDYTVLVSPKTTCSKVGNSETVTIGVIGKDAKLSLSGHLCATTGTVGLYATQDPNVQYQWYRNNQLVPGSHTGDTLQTSQPGRYFAVLTHTTLGCKANTDTVSLERSAAVVPMIQTATTLNRICPQSSLMLTATGGVSYAWKKEGVAVGTDLSQYAASSAGSYAVVATDLFGCEGTSTPLLLTQLPPVVILFDSIPGVCGTDVPTYTLVGSPAGGIFTGAGITGTVFSAKQAGIGNHLITYSVKAAPECTDVTASRTAVVAPIPTIQLADTITTYKGNTFTLNPVYTGNPTQFGWTASTYLDNPTLANPTVQDITNDITYTVDVKNSTGCDANHTVHITVLARLYIPDAFSPNGDGMNDSWELPGIEAFPDAIVTVFNRWGGIIYSSDKGYPHPFDGTLNGNSLPQGMYVYTIHTVPAKPMIRGNLMLVR